MPIEVKVGQAIEFGPGLPEKGVPSGLTYAIIGTERGDALMLIIEEREEGVVVAQVAQPEEEEDEIFDLPDEGRMIVATPKPGTPVPDRPVSGRHLRSVS